MRRRWIGAALLGLAVLAVLSVGAVLDLRPDASAESDSESVSNAAYKSVQDLSLIHI